MEPTLNINDRVLVVKNHIINSEIKPGDIVVFYSPDNPYIQNIGAEFIEGIKILWNFNPEESYLNAAIIKEGYWNWRRRNTNKRKRTSVC